MNEAERECKVILCLGYEGVMRAIDSNNIIDKSCLFWLEKLILRNPCIYIVLSSCWVDVCSLSEVKSKLGEKIGSHVLGVLPVIGGIRALKCYENKICVSLNKCPDKTNIPVIVTDSGVGFSGDSYFALVKKLLVLLLGEAHI
ncbi:MAG: hypothetical protein QM500_05860 [Methylococcales bacterium]